MYYSNSSRMQMVMAGRTESPDYAETDPSGRYARSDEVLGKGAVKTVYKAIDEVLGIEVAWNQARMKNVLYSPQQLERLYSEVHLLSTLKHDSVIRFHTSWIDTDKRTFNFITELFTSGTLRQYREKYRRIDIQAIKSWSRQILQGLAYLHAHDPPVIHRDIKCDNIFVNGHVGQVKIGDLGLAALLTGSKSAHSIIGTPEFMAPELYEEDYNELVDVYSFGMCLLEMLTLEYPYSECANPAQIYKKVTSGKLPTAISKIQDKEAERFIRKCLAPVVERASAGDLLLDPFLSSTGDELLHTKVIGDEISFENLNIIDSLPSTNMTITGKLKPKDGIIFLKVQFKDGHGPARNIYFPFDIMNDTPIKVAREMVEELEITDWDPQEIAEMIDAEVSVLMPHWKKWVSSRSQSQYNSNNYNENGNIEALPLHHSSSCSSSIASLSRVLSSQGSLANDYYLLEDFPDDMSSRGSTQSEQSTNSTYNPVDDIHGITVSKSKRSKERRGLSRNHSFVDLQRQRQYGVLNMDDVIKRRLSKTVGSVENIGYQCPYDFSTSRGKELREGSNSARIAREGKSQGRTLADTTSKILPYRNKSMPKENAV